MISSLSSLQNGSDIRGVALSGILGEEVNLTKEVASLIGKAFYNWLKNSGNAENSNLTIGVGVDSRLSGPAIKEALIAGLVSQGAMVLDFDLATTPAMFMATQFSETNCDGSIMVTASHLPPNRNGFKFFTKKSGLEKQDISDLLALAEQDSFTVEKEGSVRNSNIITPYSEYLVKYIQKNTGANTPLEGLKIVVDAGNGAGGFFADRVLEQLGANTEGSVFLNPDGNFPNHVPNPEDSTAIEAIRKAVTDNKADLGIIFDTDVDRAAVIDKEGNSINKNALIALVSTIVLKNHPGSSIVTDSITSEGLTEFIQNLDGKHHRFKRGYKNVINEAIRLNQEGDNSWLAIETSGHAAFRENYFLDDGAFLVAKVLVETALLATKGKTITDLLIDLKQPIETAEFRIQIDTPNFKEYGEKVIDELTNFVIEEPIWEAEKINYEGIRVNCPENQGWFLLRLSLHDPILPLNIESNKIGGVEQIAQNLRLYFKQFKNLKNISLT